jgi:hypothetical protein
MLKVVGPSRYFDYYLNDPTTPSLVIRVPLPKLSEAPLKLDVIGFREGPLVQEDAVPIQAASVLYSILFTLSWVNKIRRVEKWAVTETLKVSPRAGKQFNAYYDRFGCHFFYEIHPITKKTIFAADSTEAVNHEFGHAILDSFRPDFWDLDIFEIFSYHEAFGDIISMLSSLHHPEVVEYIVRETGGDLSMSNVVSRVAEELGTAICLKDPKGGRPSNCLRDASQPFQYVIPDVLPAKCPYTVLCREAHNFSRVYSSAWYKLFTEVRARYHKKDDIESIIKARDIMARLSILSLEKIEKRKDIYNSSAQTMLQTDKDIYGGEHTDLIRRVFTVRGIFPNKILY